MTKTATLLTLLLTTLSLLACDPHTSKPNDSVEPTAATSDDNELSLDPCDDMCAWDYAIEACYHIEGDIDRLEQCIYAERDKGEEWCQDRATECEEDETTKPTSPGYWPHPSDLDPKPKSPGYWPRQQ